MKNMLSFFIILLIRMIATADIYDVPPTELVMNKKFHISNELNLQLGYVPTGSFSKYGLIGISYAKFFTPNHGWEVLNLLYSHELQTSLKKTLLAPPPDGYGDLVSSSDLAQQKALITTGYLLSPFYTKSLLFNSKLIYSQTTFPFSAGVGLFNIETVPVVSFGMEQTFFMTKNSAVKFDFRYINYFSKNETLKNNLNIVIGYAMNFGSQQ